MRGPRPIFNHSLGGPRLGFKAKVTGKVAELSIMDEIGDYGVSARQVVAFVKGLDDDARIKLHIFSPGGDVLEGNEIYNVLRDHKGGVDVTIGALCASIATVIACAGQTIAIAKNGLFMVHNPWTIAMGGSDDLRQMANVMDKMRGGILDTYKTRTGKAVDDLSPLMDAETWMTAEEARDNGFVDTILNEEDEAAREVADRFDLSKFRNSAAYLSRWKKEEPDKAPDEAGNGAVQTPKAETRQPTVPLLTILSDYMNNPSGNRIFASARPRFFFDKDNGGGGGSEPITISAEDLRKKVADEAKALLAAKLKRDGEIDEIVLAVRKRDAKDFGDLAGKFKRDDKTADEFARALTTSDEYKPFEVIGAGDDEPRAQVVGPRAGKGTPGELFIASDSYRQAVKRGKDGGHKATVETAGFIAAEMARFLNATTSTTGLTSIEKLPGVVTIGVRPLRVKDLIAPGATSNTTIRYIQESSFTNAATTVAEGATKPEASFVLAEVDAAVRKIAAYTKVTDELFQDQLAVASYINERLPYMVLQTEDDQLLNGNGSAPNLKGILSFSGVQTQALGGDTRPDALFKAMTKVRWGGSTTGGFEPDGIVMHPTDWEVIRLLKDANDQYLAGGPFTGAYGNVMQTMDGLAQFDVIWGKRVVITPVIAQGTALVGAFRLASQYFQKSGLTIESTNTDQDDFIKNLTTIRAEERLALAVYRPAAFCQVTGL